GIWNVTADSVIESQRSVSDGQSGCHAGKGLARGIRGELRLAIRVAEIPFRDDPAVTNHDPRFAVVRFQPSFGFLKPLGIHLLTSGSGRFPVYPGHTVWAVAPRTHKTITNNEQTNERNI